MKLVDVIEEGRLVRVPEDYAIREGLMIIRRPEIPLGQRDSEAIDKLKAEKREKDFFSLDKLRKPIKKNGVAESLVDNFNWIISQKRRERNMTRKQLSGAIGVKEGDLKMIENGLLPSEDYVVVNKIQAYFGINLRKDGKDFVNSPMKKVERIEGHKYSLFRRKEETKDGISGSDIELDYT